MFIFLEALSFVFLWDFDWFRQPSAGVTHPYPSGSDWKLATKGAWTSESGQETGADDAGSFSVEFKVT